MEGDRGGDGSMNVMSINNKAIHKEVLQKASSLSQVSLMLENRTAEQIKDGFFRLFLWHFKSFTKTGV